MAVFTVHLKQAGVDDRRRIALDAVFLKDGFSAAAFVFGPFWLLVSRLWLVAIVYVALASVLAFLALALHLPPIAALMLTLLLNLLLGFEAGNLLRGRLERRGFGTVNVVQGTKLDDAERRFFAAWKEPLNQDAVLKTGGQATPTESTGPWSTVPSVRRDDVVGLFPEKGGH